MSCCGAFGYAVVQRTHEIGIRMALGAPRQHIVAIVLRRAAAQLGIGLLTGVACMRAWERLFSEGGFSTIYHLTDPINLSSVAAVLTLIAGIACVLRLAGRRRSIRSCRCGTSDAPPSIDTRWEQTARAGVQPTVTDVHGSTAPGGGVPATGPFYVLVRAFFEQLFASDSSSSDDQLCQTLCAVGLFASAYCPVRLEISAWGDPLAFARLIACLIVFAITLDIAGRRRAARWTVQSHTPPADALSSVNVLNIWDIAFVKETTC